MKEHDPRPYQRFVIIVLSVVLSLYLITLIPSGRPLRGYSSPQKQFQNETVNKSTDWTDWDKLSDGELNKKIKEDIRQNLSCEEMEKAQRIGGAVFSQKVSGSQVYKIEPWKQQRDDIFFFSVWYKDRTGKRIEGAIAVAKKTCKTVVTPVF